MSTELKNQQHERFALEIAKGETTLVAFRAVAGPRESGERELGSRWWARKDVQRRVAELIRENATRAVMTVSERRQIAAEIARDRTVAPAVRLTATVIDAKHAGEFMTHAEHLRAASDAEFKKMFPSFQPLRLPEE